MAWTAPRTWVAGEVLTAALLNTHLRDNLLALRCSYATTLPGSPSDGDLAILVDSTSNPTYKWLFRYNAAEATYKWECIGGNPLVVTTAASSTRTNAAYGDLADAATPTFTIPNAGDWQIGIAVNMIVDASEGFCSPMMGGTEAIDADSVSVSGYQASTPDPQASVARTIVKTAVAASTAVKLRYKSSSGQITAKNRTLQFRPERII